MLKLLVGLLTVFLLQTSAHTADKVRISIANLSGQFMTFALAHKRGFLTEEGIEAEIVQHEVAAVEASIEGMNADRPISPGAHLPRQRRHGRAREGAIGVEAIEAELALVAPGEHRELAADRVGAPARHR